MNALKPIKIGPVEVASPVILAPMTGVTDLPFRKVVKRYGAGLTVSEIVALDRIAATTTRVNRDMSLLSAPTSRPLRFLADSGSTFLNLDRRYVASPANWAL